MKCRQRLGTKKDAVAVGDGALAAKRDIERRAHGTRRAIASDKELRAQRAGLAAFDIRQDSSDPMLILLEAIQTHTIARRDSRQAGGMARQDRIEINLRTVAGAFRREVELSALLIGWHFQPPQFAAAQAVHI